MLQKLINLILKPMLGGSGWLNIVSILLATFIIFASAVVTYYIVKFIINTVLARIVKTERSLFLRVLAKNKTLHMLAHIASAIVLYSGGTVIGEQNNIYINYEALFLAKLSLLYIFITCLIIISHIVWSVNVYYEKKFDFAKQYPIYSYLKVAILFVWVIGLVLILSFFLNTSPWALLTGVGAVSAVFLLVFKDTLLGIISSIQATALNIVRIGDKIILDKYGVDGRVLDISINTVKVINSDNSIASIPTYMLTSEVIKNWRFIDDSNSRNIRRAVYLDPNSVIACDAILLEKLKQLPAVMQYTINNPNNEFINLTLFRMFFQDYLNKHKYVNHKELTMVRHLDPINIGILPLEVFAYTTTADTAEFELIQADIFEHLFSMLPTFNLKVYRQN